MAYFFKNRNSMKQKILLKVTLWLIVLSLFLSAASGNAAEPLRIGLSLGLTGRYSEIADRQMKGFRLWERDVNSNGGILGRKVELTIYDDKGDPQTAKSIYENLISKDKVDLLFGPYSSEITEAILPITEKQGYPLLMSGATADRLWEKGYKYVFGLYAPASKYTIGFLEMLLKNNINTVAIAHADDSFSKDVAEGARKWAGRFGIKVLLFEGFKKGISNFDELTKKVRMSNAQALIVCGFLNEALGMRQSLKNIGWYPKAFYASVGPAMKIFYDKFGPDAENTFSSSQWEYNNKINFPGCCEFSDFYDSYIKAYKEEPSYQAATAYSAGQILYAAILKSGGIDRRKLRDSLSSIDTMSTIGRYGVDRRGIQIKHFNLLIQWQKGKKEIVWPVEFATAKPVFR